MNDVPPKPYPEKPPEEDLGKFCPFSHQIIPGPLGSVTIRRPLCELEHCKLADYGGGRCGIAQIPSLLLRIAVALEGIDTELACHRPT